MRVVPIPGEADIELEIAGQVDGQLALEVMAVILGVGNGNGGGDRMLEFELHILGDLPLEGRPQDDGRGLFALLLCRRHGFEARREVYGPAGNDADLARVGQPALEQERMRFRGADFGDALPSPA